MVGSDRKAKEIDAYLLLLQWVAAKETYLFISGAGVAAIPSIDMAWLVSIATFDAYSIYYTMLPCCLSRKTAQGQFPPLSAQKLPFPCGRSAK